MPYDPILGNALTTAIATTELKSSGQDMVEPTINYFKYGLTSALTSGIIGITNTMTSLLNSTGMELDYADESEAIGEVFGTDTQDFYGRHKVGVDATGFILSSFAVGLGAIRAVRAAQGLGKINAELELATGLKNGDIVLNSAQVERAKIAALSNPIDFSLNNKAYYSAVGLGFKQAAIENLVFSAATIAGTNQNALVNPERLDYWEASWQQAKEAGVFIALGTALQGGIDSARIAGAVRKTWKANEAPTMAAVLTRVDNFDVLPAGDRLSLGLASKVALMSDDSFKTLLESENSFQATRAGKGLEQVDKLIDDALIELNKTGIASKELLTLMSKSVDNAAGDLTAGGLKMFAENLAGLTRIQRVNTRLNDQLYGFHAKTASPFMSFRGSSLYNFTNEQVEALKLNLGQDAAPLIENLDSFAESMMLTDRGSAGFAFGNSETSLIAVTGLRVMQAKLAAAMADSLTLATSRSGNILGSVTTLSRATEFMYQGIAKLRETEPKLFNEFLPNFTREEFDELVFLHELGHFKSNSSLALRQVLGSAQAANGKLFQEMEVFSRQVHPEHWKAVDEAIDELIRTKQAPTRNAARAKLMQDADKVDELYVIDPAELLANAHAYMVHPKYAELAAKLAPRTMKIFNKYGALAKPFNPSVGFKNLRTGGTFTSILPLPQDLGKVSLKNGIINLSVEGKVATSLAYDADLFNPKTIVTKLIPTAETSLVGGSINQPYFAAAMQYAAEGLQDANKYYSDLTLTYNIGKYDLPKLENLYVAYTKGTLKQDALIRLGSVDEAGKAVSEPLNLKYLEEYLIDTKSRLRLQLAQEFKVNEEMIGNALNMSSKAARGEATSAPDELFLGLTRRYDQPENVQMVFSKVVGKDLRDSARGEAAIAYRQETFAELSRRYSAEFLGDANTKLPDIPVSALMDITATATEASLLTSRRAEVGLTGIREMATLVNRVISHETARQSQLIEDDFAYYYQKINAKDNVVERQELALVTNMAYEGWYGVTKSGDQHWLMSKEAIDKFAEFKRVKEAEAIFLATGKVPKDFRTEKQLKAAIGRQSDLTTKLQGMVAGGDYKDIDAAYAALNQAKKLSNNVGSFFVRAVAKNDEYIGQMYRAAEAKGQSLVMHKGVIYPPRRNLAKTPFVAFVSPKDASGAADSDPYKYMIFARTAEELDIKIASTRQAYGNDYIIVTTKEREQYAELKGDYDKGKVFDEYQFDPSLFRKGRTAELLPSLDIDASEVLDRFRNMEQTRLRHKMALGVELRYPEITSALRNADKAFSASAKSTVVTNITKDTIFKRTLDQMLNLESKDTVIGEAWKKFNGYVGEKGGVIIDAALSRFGSLPSTKLTPAQFEAYNKTLSDAGFTPPFKDMFTAIAASPDASNNRALEGLVRVMNNMSGTFMIRLDMANSIVTLLSTPILGLPVISEAIRNTKAVQDLVTVRNPLNGLREPTSGKLFMNAAANFWSADGKKFLESLRQRGIVTDFMKDYHEAQDFSALTGRHLLTAVNDKVQKLSDFGSKWSAHLFAEDFSKFVIADSVRQVCKLRGMKDDEMYAVVANAVDTVHGIYKSNSRVKLFNGVVGQALGMYQTYFFNFMQNATKMISEGNKKSLLLLGGLQATTYGASSLPGFAYFNNLIAETNRGNLDIYAASGVEDENATVSKWLLYGLGSNAFPIPSDFFSRGDMVIRNSLVVPTNPMDFPSVAILAKFFSRSWDTMKELAVGDGDKSNAFWFGLAHNGLSRPLQGIGTSMLGAVTSTKGTVLLASSNYDDYDIANEVNLAAITSRILGTRNVDEAIKLDSYYRQVAYKAADKLDINRLGGKIRVAAMDGNEITSEMWDDFALKYERLGGKLEDFNGFMTRTLATMEESKVEKFREKLAEDSPLSRLQGRMLEGRRLVQDDWNSIQADLSDGELGVDGSGGLGTLEGEVLDSQLPSSFQ